MLEVERSGEAGDCPDAAGLTRNVEHILQRSFSNGPAGAEALRVAVRFAREHDEYSAEVRSLGAKPGERRFHDRGQACTALAEAVSVAIALLLDRELATPPPAAPAPPAPLPTQEHVTATPTIAPRLAEWRATFEGGYASGLSATNTTLLSEQLGVRIERRFLLDAGFNAVLPAGTDSGMGAVRTTLFFGSLRACYAFGDRFSVGPCALLGVGRLRGVGLGYASVQGDSLLWSAVGAGMVAEAPLWGRVYLGLSGNAWLPTRRSSFSVENVGTVWKSETVGVAVSARLGFRIW